MILRLCARMMSEEEKISENQCLSVSPLKKQTAKTQRTQSFKDYQRKIFAVSAPLR
jgi:hypothetical protein